MAGPQSRLNEADRLLAAIAGLLGASGLALQDLVANDLLPGTAGQRLLEGSRADIARAMRNPADSEAIERALNGHLVFAKALDERGAGLAQALVLLARARRDSGTGDPAPTVLARVARYFDPALPDRVPAEFRLDRDWVRIAGDSASLEAFIGAYQHWLKTEAAAPPPAAPPLPGDPSWQRWRSAISAFLAGGRAMVSDPAGAVYEDAVEAAANLPPGSLFRYRLAQMDQIDWSEAALAALPRGREPARAPQWLLFAALVALGFSQGLLRMLLASPPPQGQPPPSEDMKWIATWTELGGTARPALLNIRPGDGGPRAPVEIHPEQPALSIERSAFQDYLPALNWLAEHGAFLGTVDEEG